MEDHELVVAARDGSKDAFAAIYDRYGDRLYDFLCAVLHDRDEAADVLHDSFIVAGARLHQLRDPAKLRPWLYAIARHEGLRRLRQKARQEPVEALEVTATGPEPDAVAARHELRELVAAAALGLNPRDRGVLDLHLRQGLDGQELGDAIGVSTSHAYVVLSRLRDQVERSLGALLVARMGRRDCEELAAILVGWDGTYSPVIRKRVARHVDGCETCSDRRRTLVSPLSLLSAAPALAAPAAVRRRVLDDVQLASASGSPMAGGDGFPPPLYPRRWSRRPVAAVAAAVVTLLFVAGALLAGGGGGGAVDVELVDAPGGSPVPTAAAPASSTTSSTPAPAPAGGPGTSTSVVTAPPGSPSTTAPAPDATTTTTTPSPTDPDDRQPPKLGGLTARPTTIWTSNAAGAACGSAMPGRATVAVSAGDPSGIASVGLELTGPVSGTSAMAAIGGDTYRATVGPFAKGTVPRGGSGKVGLTVTATDGEGNPATAAGSVTLTDCPS